MSNHLAVATVSAALGRLLQGALDQDVPGALISHERPGGANDDQRRGVNIFLFQATPNAAARTGPVPTKCTGGMSTPRRTFTASMTSHGVDPTPVLAYLSWVGLALA